MRAGAAHPDRRHPGPARPAGPAGPGPRGREDLEVLLEVRDGRVRGAEVRVRDQPAAVHAERRLHEAGDARGGLQVPDVRLHRTDRQGAGAAGLPEYLAQAGRLGRVAEPGAGAVGLDVVDAVEGNAGASQRGQQGRRLPAGAGVRHPAGRTAAGDAPAAYHRVDVVAVGEGEVEPLEHDERAALPADEAVGACVEGEAAAVGRQGAQVRQARSGLRVDDQVHAARRGRRRRRRSGSVRRPAPATRGRRTGPSRRRSSCRARRTGARRGSRSARRWSRARRSGRPGRCRTACAAARTRRARRRPRRRSRGRRGRPPGCGRPRRPPRRVRGRGAARGPWRRPPPLPCRRRRRRIRRRSRRTSPSPAWRRPGGTCASPRRRRPVAGERPDGRSPVDQQAPEPGEVVHTGKAARHPDDGNIGGCAGHLHSFRDSSVFGS